MAYRPNWTAESLGETTVPAGAGTYTDKVSLTFPPAANKTYVIIASFGQRPASTASASKARLYNADTAAVLDRNVQNPHDNGDLYAQILLGFESFGASPPATRTYKLQGEGSTYATYIRDARLIVLELGTDDRVAAHNSDVTDSSDTWRDKATIALTPATTGDYLVICTGHARNSVSDGNIEWALDINGALYSNRIQEGQSTASTLRQFWGGVAKVSLAGATPYTIKTKARNGDAGTVIASTSALLVLRLDAFDAANYAENRTNGYHSDAAYANRVSLSNVAMTSGHRFLVIGAASRAHGGTTSAALTRLTKAAALYGAEYGVEGEIASATEGCVAFAQAALIDGAGGTESFGLDYASGKAGDRTDIFDAALAVIDLGIQLTAVNRSMDCRWQVANRVPASMDARWSMAGRVWREANLTWDVQKSPPVLQGRQTTGGIYWPRQRLRRRLPWGG